MPRSAWKPVLIFKEYPVPLNYNTGEDEQPLFFSFSSTDKTYGTKAPGDVKTPQGAIAPTGAYALQSAFAPLGAKTPYERRMRVVSQHVGEISGISTGKTKVQVRITDDMVGKKFGEFALTRKLTQHAKKAKKKKG